MQTHPDLGVVGLDLIGQFAHHRVDAEFSLVQRLYEEIAYLAH